MAKKAKADSAPTGPKAVENRRARHDYDFLDTLEAGIVLVGSEVKSVFLGRLNLTDAYVQVKNDELWLMNLDIEPYSHTTHFQHERRRDRKLLAHRREIDVLERKAQEKGLALIPAKVYFKNGKVKVLIALARGRSSYDKRHAIAEKETRREVERLRSGRGSLE